MRNIIIVEAASTGYNYIEDVVRRGYNPVVLEVWTDSEDLKKFREDAYAAAWHKPDIIRECGTYEETLEAVRKYDPVLIVPGSEDGVTLSVKLSASLGLPGNPVDMLDAMKTKDGMQEALRQAGIRYILGKRVRTPEEGLAFCRENKLKTAVVKPISGAGSQGLYLCDNLDEVERAIASLVNTKNFFGKVNEEVLVQERIYGDEYIVNTISSCGRHRLNSVLRYKKHKTEEGGYIYDYIEFINHLDAGHNKLIEYALSVADAIHYRNGMIHGEYMIDEKGPVLIEVNCRPMGCSQPAEYMDLIMGQHETDSTLDALLYPEAFAARQNQPYRLQRYGCMKILQIPEDMDAVDHPIWEVARQLRSTYKISANAPSSPFTYAKTRDLETAGGLVYMVHKYEHVLRSDLELLRKTEKYYFQFLLNDGKSRRWFLDGNMGKPDFPALMKEYNCTGAVLVAADEQLEIPGAQCVTAGNMENAHKGFDCVIIGFQHTLLELNESACLKLIFTAMDLVRQGGKVIIPKNTYRYLSYEREGAEDLMLIKGLTLEAPQPGKTEVVTGTNERQ